MGLTHPLHGADLGTLLSALLIDGPPSGAGALRLAAAFGSAFGRLPFTLVEAAVAPILSALRPPMPPPLFIVGHWRSGTTHVYNVISRDRQWGTLPPYMVGIPWELLLLGTIARPLLDRALPADRVIDNVAVTPDSPQEDEIALASMTRLSYYHGVYFPRRFEDHLRRGIFFDGCTQAEIVRWERTLRRFLRKASLAQGGRPLVVKNPAYTARVALLQLMWPDARFIHVVRDPAAVYRSTVQFFRTLLGELALQPFDRVDVEGVVAALYPRMMDSVLADARDLPPGQFAEVRFEAFESDPLGEMERAYRHLDLPGFAEAKPDFTAYLNTVRGYRKDRYGQSATRIPAHIAAAWAPYIDRWGATP